MLSPLTLSLSPEGRGEGEGAYCQKNKRVCISKRMVEKDSDDGNKGSKVAGVKNLCH